MKILGEKALTWSSKSGLDKLTDKFLINNTTWKGSKGNPLFASFNSIVLAWNQPFLGKKKKGWVIYDDSIKQDEFTHAECGGRNILPQREPRGFKFCSPYYLSLMPAGMATYPE